MSKSAVMNPGVAGRGARAADRLGGIKAQRVLVVDDERDVLHVLASVIESLGHEVRAAGSGALACLAFDYFEPDVALVDLSMPLMNGNDVARRIRRMPLRNQPRLVAVTGHASVTARAASLVAGFDAHLVKPFSVATLRQVIEVDASASVEM